MGVKDSFIGRILGSTNTFSREQVAQTATLLLEHGLARGASDLHIEPHGQLAWVRYRIHGSLHGLHKLPAEALRPLIAEFRKKAGLPTEAHTPQDGSFTETIAAKDILVQVSTMPVMNGERAVLHFSQTSQTDSPPDDLSGLGFWGTNLDLVNTTLAQIHGLILVSGLKHSERPAVLHGLLSLLQTATISIGTIEESTGHRLPGISQTKVLAHDALSYAGALQANLKQDMNAIMLASLPSSEVADEAVYAATTGHLIIAGTHSDSAAKALVHLRHMGVESYMLAAAVRLSIAVRSVRKLCPDCRERVALSTAQAARLEQLFGMTTPANRKRIHTLEERAAKAGIGTELPFNSTATRLTHLWQASQSGCEACRHSGYSGTVGLVEVMPGGDYLYKILTNAVTIPELQTAALQQGFIPLALDGMIKALRGETALTEVVHEAAGLLH